MNTFVLFTILVFLYVVTWVIDVWIAPPARRYEIVREAILVALIIVLLVILAGCAAVQS